MENSLNNLIDEFIILFNNDVKQQDKNWFSLIGTTIGGSEVSALLGINPFMDMYKLIESKINLCNGIKNLASDTISCKWGMIFENVISKVIEIDLGNKVKGSNICIQKYEGHRNSPDGYIVIHLYKIDDVYYIWTTDLPRSLIYISIIVLLEFKCPITRKVNDNIPKYYKSQILSGLSVSPLAFKGLFIDAVFKKCSLQQLDNNNMYDVKFHKQHIKGLPIAYGIIPIYLNKFNMHKKIYEIYENITNEKFDKNNFTTIDLGNINIDFFTKIIHLITDKYLIISTSTVLFHDKRGDVDIYNFDNNNEDHILFAVFPWKLFDLLYSIVDREVNFIENLLPLIQKVNKTVKNNINTDCSIEELKILDICDAIYN